MKRKIITSIIFLIPIFVLVSCEDVVTSSFECSEEGKFFGTKYLSERADSFWNYEANQTRVYINVADNEIVFTEDIFDAYQSKTIEYPFNYLCTPPNAEPEYDYLDVEVRKVNYKASNNSIGLKMQLEVRPIFEGDSIYSIDLLTLINRSYETFILDNKNTSAETYYNKFDFTADTTLLNRTFQNVYYQKDEPFSVFYTKEQGVIAFYDINENFYVLDRVE